jgi:hypothetical protein
MSFLKRLWVFLHIGNEIDNNLGSSIIKGKFAKSWDGVQASWIQVGEAPLVGQVWVIYFYFDYLRFFI